MVTTKEELAIAQQSLIEVVQIHSAESNILKLINSSSILIKENRLSLTMIFKPDLKQHRFW